MKWFWVILSLVSFNLTAQVVNLVPNPSFEDYDLCPFNNQWVNQGLVNTWYSPRGGVDYYHECGYNGFGIPISKYGGEEAHSGEAYIGFSMFAFILSNAREFVEVKLTDSLIAGKKYYAEFHVSLHAEDETLPKILHSQRV